MSPLRRVVSTRSDRAQLAERIFDLAAVLALLPLLLLVGVLVAAVVFVDSPGSVFYRARRIGKRGVPFRMLKFRTMRTGSRGPAVSREDDERFTPIGSFLAATRLDELPQIWNVLKGEMRLVGPRPEDPQFVEMYRREYEEILSVPPGLTGTTQLVHFGDAANLAVDDPLSHYAETIMPHKLELDIGYVRTRGLLGDLVIIGQTLILPIRLAAAGLMRLGPYMRARAPLELTTLALAVALLTMFLAVGGPAR